MTATVLVTAMDSIRRQYIGTQTTWQTPSAIASDFAQYINTALRQPTPKEIAAHERMQVEQIARTAELSAQVAEANARAEKLLVDHLTPQQHEQLRTSGYFEVRVQDRTYRIFRGWSMNVQLVNAAGKKVRNYCAVPRLTLPIADQMLAQKLMLEFEEREFLRVAHAS